MTRQSLSPPRAKKVPLEEASMIYVYHMAIIYRLGQVGKFRNNTNSPPLYIRVVKYSQGTTATRNSAAAVGVALAAAGYNKTFVHSSLCEGQSRKDLWSALLLSHFWMT